jgi:sensor histidine kinase YesM
MPLQFASACSREPKLVSQKETNAKSSTLGPSTNVMSVLVVTVVVVVVSVVSVDEPTTFDHVHEPVPGPAAAISDTVKLLVHVRDDMHW